MLDSAVIIAAGRGSRLNGNSSKPLTEVGGMPLIVRTIEALRDHGVRRVVIVTGFQEGALRKGVKGVMGAAPAGIELEWVYNEQWEKQNGVSVMRAESAVSGEFALAMSDHVFESEIIGMLVGQRLDGLAGVLCVDRKLDSIFDMDDATKVKTEGGRIVRIGKQIEEYDAVDTGLFRMTPEIFVSLRRVYEAKADCSLSDGVKDLAARGAFGVLDVGPALWQDVDTPASLEYARWLVDNVFDRARAPSFRPVPAFRSSVRPE